MSDNQEIDKRLIFMLRAVTFICGAGLSVLGFYSFFAFSLFDPQEFFLSVYYILFGILVCSSELPCDKILLWFLFLKFYLGKALFLLFLASITFEWERTFYLIISIMFFVVSGIYFAFCCAIRNRDSQGAEVTRIEEKETYKEV